MQLCVRAEEIAPLQIETVVDENGSVGVVETELLFMHRQISTCAHQPQPSYIVTSYICIYLKGGSVGSQRAGGVGR